MKYASGVAVLTRVSDDFQWIDGLLSVQGEPEKFVIARLKTSVAMEDEEVFRDFLDTLQNAAIRLVKRAKSMPSGVTIEAEVIPNDQTLPEPGEIVE